MACVLMLVMLGFTVGRYFVTLRIERLSAQMFIRYSNKFEASDHMPEFTVSGKEEQEQKLLSTLKSYKMFP